MKSKPRMINLILVFVFVFGALGITSKPIEVQAQNRACGDAFTPIPVIQGDGFTTPLLDTQVVTEGVVVGDFQTAGYVSGTKNGVYIQDLTGDGNASTSDGLFVYYYDTDLQVGDYVQVSGTATEYYDLTQIGSVSELNVCESGLSIPQPIEIDLPVSEELDFEKYEGMLVTIPQNLVISEYYNFGRYGEIMLSTDRFMTFTALYEPDATGYATSEEEYFLNSITLDDGRTSQNPDPAIHPNGEEFTMDNLFRGGDLVANVTGIMDYSYDLYRIQSVQGADYFPLNDRLNTPDLVEGDLKVASFNVLNYFTTIDDGINDICGSSGLMECRGADTELELARQRAKILAAMSEIDANIFGLMEIENDRKDAPTPDYAVADLVAGLNDIAGAGTYNYIATGAVGTDAIKQAIIYKPGKVSPIGTFQALTSAYDPDFVDTKNRPTLAQVFEDHLTGENFIVAVNHLKSKGSACDGDPDLGDGAGNCNLTRLAAAEVMVDWLADPTIFPEVDNVLIIGDLNSYDKEDPIDAIKLGADDLEGTGDEFVDLIHQILGDEAYGYVFDGHTGYLDYALTNTKMANAVIDVEIWHINADEPSLIDYDMSYKQAAQDLLYAEDAYRSSDHDPVVVSISFRPFAQDDQYATMINETLVILPVEGVLSNDNDPDPTDSIYLTAVLVDDVPVSAGELFFWDDGSFTFTPAVGFEGEAIFTYRISYGVLQSDLGTVKIKVTSAPVAVGDIYNTAEDTPLIKSAAEGILSNDTDLEEDTLTAVLATDVSEGLLVLEEDGSFLYIPDPFFIGNDSFTYKAYDGGLESEPVQVTITINDVNDAPLAVSDVFRTEEDVPLVVEAPGLLYNDYDPEGNSVVVSEIVVGPSKGVLDEALNGSFKYTPDANFYGLDIFTYKASDGVLDSVVVKVVIFISQVDETIFLPIIIK